ncbi:MAG: DUF1501 domain-containing protein [Planctomycetes bacterium]|nr:DUF1501 domain-containing protein [Planctomycetota bacterium]
MSRRPLLATAALSRRALLSRLVGACGAAFLAPGFLPLLQRHARAQEAAAGGAPTPRRLVLVWLEGGPSQLETFDPKPGTATGGPFRALPTERAGWSFSERLPKLRDRAGKLAVVRSLHSKEGSHARARLLLHTGFVPNPSVAYPTLGSIVAHQLGDPASELPSFVQVAGPPGSPGYLGVAHAPFLVARPGAKVANLAPERALERARVDRRDALREALDGGFEAEGAHAAVARNREQQRRARRLAESPRTRAFELDGESAKLRQAYGDTTLGQGLLLARRLLEEGVTAVELHHDGWDTHIDNFPKTAALCDELDPALATFLDDLETRGLLADTLVVCMGEFGRTPAISARNGRDHWPVNYCALLAGGGVKGGSVVGATDELGQSIVERPVSVPDLFATFAALLRIDGSQEFQATPRRPTTLVDPDGAAITELLA